MVNLNKMAREITLAEGLKKSVSIAQVKEIQGLVLRSLKKLSVNDLVTLLARIK